VLPDGVIQHVFFTKNGVILHAFVHGRRKDFSRGGHKWIFPNVFLRGVKSGKIWFYPLETKKTAFLAEISKFISYFRHRCLCVGKIRATPFGCNFKRFNTISNSEILLNLKRKLKYFTDEFQLCFCFCIGNTK